MMSRLEDKRTWLAGGCIAAVLIAAVGWLIIIGPQLSSAQTLRSEGDSAQTQNDVLANKVAKLKLANENVSSLKTSLLLALEALPFDSGLPAFTRQVASQATSSGVALSSITVGTIAPSTAVAAAGTTATPTTPTTATPSTGTATTGAGTTASASASTTIMQIPVTLLTKGSDAAQLAFLKAVQVDGPRRALINSTTITGGASSKGSSINKSCNMTTQLNVFVAPLSAAAQAQLAKLLDSK